MVGNIIAPDYVYGSGGSIDDYFDPVTHIATEENFIKFLQTGTYTEDVIGYYVTLSNSVELNGSKWIIADVNHDSSQPNTYDLISVDLTSNTYTFGSSQIYRDSTVRSWLNNNFYLGFSDAFKARMVNITYASNGSTYSDDKVTIPSFTEVNGNVPSDYSSYTVVEGTKYPIFNAGSSSRIKYTFGTASTYYWWTRSRNTGNSTNVWDVNTDGSMYNYYYHGSRRLAPLLRVQ